jgi:DDE superfamily endonuclease
VATDQKGARVNSAWLVFLDESGVSLLPVTRRTWSPRGQTPTLRHRCNWKRASMAAALGYHASDAERGPRLCFHVQKDSYDTACLIEVLTQLKAFYAGQRVVLLWDGLGAHWSHDMQAWLATQQDWLGVERMPAYAPELNPVEYLWANLKGVELANFAGDRVVEVADAAEQGIHRVCDDQQLAWSFLAHTGLTLDHQPPLNL